MLIGKPASGIWCWPSCLPAFAAYYRGALHAAKLLSQIAVDITVISLLYIAAGGARSGLAILFLFPLWGGAVLLPLTWALFFAASVTLFLLAESGYQIFTVGWARPRFRSPDCMAPRFSPRFM